MRADSRRSSPSDSPTASEAQAGSWQRSRPVGIWNTHTHTHSKNISSSAKITVPLLLNMGISDGKCDWNLEQRARVQTSRTLEVIPLNVIRPLNGRLRCSAMTLLRMPRLVYILEWTRLKGNSPSGLFRFIYCLHKCLFTLLPQVRRHVKVEWGSALPTKFITQFVASLYLLIQGVNITSESLKYRQR